MSTILRTESVSVHFSGVKALTEVSLHLEREESLALIGPNGAGKTTLINVLTGYQKPTAGRVLIDDRDITGLVPHKRARAGLARTFQNVRLFADLTVFDNIVVGGIANGLSMRAAGDAAERLIETMGLTRSALLLAGSVPYGDARRLGIARALVTNPDFLLLDEPAAGLNDSESEILVDTLRRIPRDYGVGLLLIEHDMSVVMSVSDRIHVLDFGRTLAVGQPDHIRQDPEVQRAYFGRPVEVPRAESE